MEHVGSSNSGHSTSLVNCAAPGGALLLSRPEQAVCLLALSGTFQHDQSVMRRSLQLGRAEGVVGDATFESVQEGLRAWPDIELA